MANVIYIKFDESCHDAYYDSDWYREEWRYFIFSAHIKRPHYDHVGIQSLDIDFEPKITQPIFILSVRYRDEVRPLGETKGKGDVVWVFQNEEAALAAKNTLDWDINQSTYVFMDDNEKPVKVISNLVGENGRSIYRTMITELTIEE